MNELDFSFGGETLSSHGYMLCSFDSASSADTNDTDSQRKFENVSMNGGKWYPIVSAEYSDPLSKEKSICKLPTAKNRYITENETIAIKRWLNRPTPQVLRMGSAEYAHYFWMGSFNVSEVTFAERIIGFNLSFTSTAPFGFKEKQIVRGSCDANGTIAIKDTSDEIGYIYPDITLTLKDSGTLRVTNEMDGRKFALLSCSSGEKIMITHALEVISSNAAHEIGNDCNYVFPRICNKYENTLNKFTVSLPCDYEISYTPIAKAVMH